MSRLYFIVLFYVFALLASAHGQTNPCPPAGEPPTPCHSWEGCAWVGDAYTNACGETVCEEPPSDEVCCDGTPVPSSQCCGGVLLTQYEVCCEGTPTFPINCCNEELLGEGEICCGGTKVPVDECCNDQIKPEKPADMVCPEWDSNNCEWVDHWSDNSYTDACGKKVCVAPPSGEICCGGNSMVKGDPPSDMSCPMWDETECKWKSAGHTNACGETVCEEPPTDEICCGGNAVVLKHGECCHDDVILGSGERMECKSVTVEPSWSVTTDAPTQAYVGSTISVEITYNPVAGNALWSDKCGEWNDDNDPVPSNTPRSTATMTVTLPSTPYEKATYSIDSKTGSYTGCDGNSHDFSGMNPSSFTILAVPQCTKVPAEPPSSKAATEKTQTITKERNKALTYCKDAQGHDTSEVKTVCDVKQKQRWYNYYNNYKWEGDGCDPNEWSEPNGGGWEDEGDPYNTNFRTVSDCSGSGCSGLVDCVGQETLNTGTCQCECPLTPETCASQGKVLRDCECVDPCDVPAGQDQGVAEITGDIVLKYLEYNGETNVFTQAVQEKVADPIKTNEGGTDVIKFIAGLYAPEANDPGFTDPLLLNLAPSTEINVNAKLVTVNSAPERDLYGKLKLTLIEGDASQISLFHYNDETGKYEPYTLGSQVDVEAPGHSGCEIHYWHSDNVGFKVITKTAGSFKLTAAVTPDGGTSAITATVRLCFPLHVDGNRDGVISLGGEDATTSTKPLRFWLNDDDDTETTDTGNVIIPNESDYVPSDGTPPPADYLKHKIVSSRNLEDFARLWIDLSGLQSLITSSAGIQVGLKWGSITGSPAVNLYVSADATGSDSYLEDSQAAYTQSTNVSYSHAVTFTNNQQTVASSGTFIFPLALLQTEMQRGPVLHFLFEGAGVGSGQFTIILLDKDGNQIGEGPGVWLDLKNIKSMYERAVATTGGPRSENGVDYTIPLPYSYVGPDPSNIAQPIMGWEPNTLGHPYQPDPAETKTYLIYVHGWRWSPAKANNRTETVFKRLWHLGYKGRLSALRWPTFYGGPDDGDDWIAGLSTYNDSEYRAWKSGESLKQYVNQLPSDYTRSVVAHSMGNIVTGSALRKGMSVVNYVLLNAAVPAMCYDESTSLHQWNYVTPNDDPDNGTKDMAYLGKLKTLNPNVINFFLTRDFATTFSWENNNNLFKPQNQIITSCVRGYTYARANPSGTKLYVDFCVSPLRHLIDEDEAMAFACQSLTKTIGAEGRAAGSIGSTVDMDTYSFGDEHGAEWDRNMMQTKAFYIQLMRSLQIPVQP